MASLFLMQTNAYSKNSRGLSGDPKCLKIDKASKISGGRDRYESVWSSIVPRSFPQAQKVSHNPTVNDI